MKPTGPLRQRPLGLLRPRTTKGPCGHYSNERDHKAVCVPLAKRKAAARRAYSTQGGQT